MNELTVKIVQNRKNELHTFMGGNSDNPTWEEYKSDFKEEYHNHLEVLKKCIIDCCYKESADTFCNNNHFRFSDGEEWAFSWRAWGDLMQAIVGKREGYMTYYMC